MLGGAFGTKGTGSFAAWKGASQPSWHPCHAAAPHSACRVRRASPAAGSAPRTGADRPWALKARQDAQPRIASGRGRHLSPHPPRLQASIQEKGYRSPALRPSPRHMRAPHGHCAHCKDRSLALWRPRPACADSPADHAHAASSRPPPSGGALAGAARPAARQSAPSPPPSKPCSAARRRRAQAHLAERTLRAPSRACIL